MDDGHDATSNPLLWQQGIVAGLVLATGAVGFVGGMLGRPSIPGILALLEEVGVQAPRGLSLGLELHLHVLCLVLGVLGAGLAAGVAFARKPLVSWILAAALLLGMAGCTSLSLFCFLGATQAVIRDVERNLHEGPLPEPGTTSELARAVDSAFRESLRRGVGSVETPDGRAIHYLIYTGPGVDAPAPLALPAFAEARRHPGFVVLPWGDSEHPKDVQHEVFVRFPTGRVELLEPTSFSFHRPPEWVVDVSHMGETERGYMAHHVPAVVPLSGALERYAYALVLERARTDDPEQGGDPTRPFQSRLGPEDPFSDRLYTLKILVFRDFEPHGGGAVVPAAHLPVDEFLTQVAW